jgi:hypothetical protein
LFYILLLLMNHEFEWYMVSWMAFIAGPALLIGILFTISFVSSGAGKK